MAPHRAKYQLSVAYTLAIVIYQVEVRHFFQWLLTATAGIVVRIEVILVVTWQPKYLFKTLAKVSYFTFIEGFRKIYMIRISPTRFIGQLLKKFKLSSNSRCKSEQYCIFIFVNFLIAAKVIKVADKL